MKRTEERREEEGEKEERRRGRVTESNNVDSKIGGFGPKKKNREKFLGRHQRFSDLLISIDRANSLLRQQSIELSRKKERKARKKKRCASPICSNKQKASKLLLFSREVVS